MLNQLPWTMILTTVITVIGVFGAWFAAKYVRPFIKERNLEAAAEMAVKSVEVLWKGLDGRHKLEKAIDQMKEKGYDVSGEEVVNAIEQAWYNMNLDQIAVGIKDLEPKVEAEG